MKIVFIGCVNFSYHVLEALFQVKGAEIVGVVTKHSSSINADFCDLSPIAAAHRIPVFIDSRNRQDEMADWIKELQPDVIYCFGWSYLLKQEVLKIPRLGAVGYHPASLPQNRGRHPLIWALALGLTETASTFFFMDEGADSGDIISQEKIAIAPDDDAAELYRKIISCSLRQVASMTAALAAGKHARLQQDHEQANYWRKRSPRDGCIDWRMTSSAIHNLVRALAKPYPGAHFLLDQAEVKVWETAIADRAFAALDHLEPGKILEINGDGIFVKCGSGVIQLLDHELPSTPAKGSYL